MADMEEEMRIRITAGWKCFGKHKNVFCGKEISLSMKMKAFNECVIPTVVYGIGA